MTVASSCVWHHAARAPSNSFNQSLSAKQWLYIMMHMGYCTRYALVVTVHPRLLRLWSESWAVIQLTVVWAFADCIKGVKLALQWKLLNCNAWDCQMNLHCASNTYSACHHVLAMMMHKFVRNKLKRLYLAWYFHCCHPALCLLQILPTAI